LLILEKIFNSRQRGNLAERMTEAYLTAQGLQSIERNYHCRQGEVDLVMEDKNTLVFIEVRYRCGSAFGEAVETVGYQKQKKIIRAAQHYLHRHQLSEKINVRFDIVGLQPKFKSKPLEDAREADLNFRWIKNAFS
jgi:putative endonuclease